MKPNKFKIGIVGSGVSGLAIAKELISKGFTDIIIFEKNNNLGGVWNPDNAYPGQETETPRSYYEYPDFPWPSNVSTRTPATQSEVYEYLKDFSRKNQIEEKIAYNTLVEKIVCRSSDSRFEASVVYTQKNIKDVVCLDFMIIAITPISGNKKIPTIGNHFDGKILHSTEVKESTLKNIKDNNWKTVIVGGNKSAFDVVKLLDEFKIEYTWLYRSMYWTMHYEHFLDYDKLCNDYMTFVEIFQIYLSNNKGWDNKCIKLVKDVLFNVDNENVDLFTKFSNAICTELHLELLKGCPKIKGEIDHASNNAVVLKDGNIISADTLIFATGFEYINLPICNEKGKVLKEFKNINYLYRGVVDIDYPNLLFMPPPGLIVTSVTNSAYFAARWIRKYINNYMNGSIDFKTMRNSSIADVEKLNSQMGQIFFFRDTKILFCLLVIRSFITVEFFNDLDIDVKKIGSMNAKSSQMLRDLGLVSYSQ